MANSFPSAPGGIIVFGANGSGKSTVGRAAARALGFRHLDIEDYHFLPAPIPYTAHRPREECRRLLLADAIECGSFVLSAVTGDFGAELNRLYRLAVLMEAPLALRLERVRRRAEAQYGDRVRAGGDMYEQTRRFIDFVAARDLAKIERWEKTLACPILVIDGTRPVAESANAIAKAFRAATCP